jgi:hypothetical protein
MILVNSHSIVTRLSMLLTLAQYFASWEELENCAELGRIC